MHHASLRSLVARTAVALTALATLGATAGAQRVPVNPFSLGVSGGAVIPTGDFSNDFKTGYHVNGLVNLRLPASPLSFRGEVGYSRNDVKGSTSDANANVRIISGVVNAILGFSPAPTAVARPYLIGGAGVYNVKGTVNLGNGSGGQFTASDSETKPGLNGGVGIELPLSGINVFGEVRYTAIFTSEATTSYVPITVGIRF